MDALATHLQQKTIGLECPGRGYRFVAKQNEYHNAPAGATQFGAVFSTWGSKFKDLRQTLFI